MAPPPYPLQNQCCIKLGQLNLNKRNVYHDTVALARHLNYDIIAVSDVNHSRGTTLSNTMYYGTTEDLAAGIVLLNKNIPHAVTRVTKSLVSIHLTDIDLHVHSVYIRPAHSIQADEARASLHKLLNLLKHTRSDNHVFLGDLNARCTSFGDNSSNHRGDTLTAILTQNSWTRLHDNVSSTRQEYQASPDWTIVRSGTEDHWCWSTDEEFDHLSDHRMTKNVYTPYKEFDWRSYKVKPALFLKKIAECTKDLNVNNWYSSLTTALQLATVPSGSPTGKPPWWSEEINSLKKQIHKLINHKSRTGKELTPQHRSSLIKLRHEYKSSTTSARISHWSSFLSSLNESQLMSQLSRARKAKTRKQVSFLLENNEVVSDPSVAGSKILEAFFPIGINESQFNDIRGSLTVVPPLEDYEITAAIFSFHKKNKAPGEDRISHQLIQLWYTQDPTFLRKLFKKWFDERSFPEEYKDSFIVPILKNNQGKPTLDNLRPIGLLCTLSKVYERILYNRLIFHLHHNSGISSFQYGFTPGRGTLDALAVIQKTREVNRQRNRKELMVSLDIKGAFNNITHRAVISAFANGGCPDDLLSIFKSYLSNRTISLTFGGVKTSRQMSCGVVQGSVLGPQMFIAAINPILASAAQLNSHGTHVVFSVFADDINFIVSHSYSVTTAETHVKNLIAFFKSSLSQVGLQLSSPKTQIMYSNWSQSPVTSTSLLLNDGISVSSTSHVKALGLLFEEDGSFTKHLKSKQDLVLSSLSQLKRFVHRVQLGKNAIRTLATVVVYPRMTYAVGVWWDGLSSKERVKMRQFSRNVTIQLTSAYKSISYASASVVLLCLPLYHHCEVTANIQKVKYFSTPLLMNSQNYYWKDQRLPLHLWPHPSSIPYLTISNRITDQNMASQLTERIQVYTDGSKLENGFTGFAGIIFVDGQERLQFKCKIDEFSSVFQAELEAIHTAAKWIVNNSSNTYSAILSDSLSVLQSLSSRDLTKRSNTQHDIIQMITNYNSTQEYIKIYWVKAHNNILGNELADQLAKIAATDGHLVSSPMPKKFVSTFYKNSMLKALDEEYRASAWGRTMKNFITGIFDKSRRKVVVTRTTIQVYTGHGTFLNYLYWKNRSATPYCPCQSTEELLVPHTPMHCLMDCPIHLPTNVKHARRLGIETDLLTGDWINLRKHQLFHTYVLYASSDIIERNKRLVDTQRDVCSITYLLGRLSFVEDDQTRHIYDAIDCVVNQAAHDSSSDDSSSEL